MVDNTKSDDKTAAILKRGTVSKRIEIKNDTSIRSEKKSADILSFFHTINRRLQKI